MSSTHYKRILLKISGESLMGEDSYGIDVGTVDRIASEISQACNLGIQLCLVIGGGNIFRGLAGSAKGMDRTSADYMGMLATIMNALAMQNSLERIGVQTRVQSAITMTSVCEPYTRRRAIRHMEKGRVVIFAAGTGNPYFTTDTAAALRASEMACEALFKGTKVDGVYDKDPYKHEDAKKYQSISFQDVLTKNLKVLDASAISLARDNDIPVMFVTEDTTRSRPEDEKEIYTRALELGADRLCVCDTCGHVAPNGTRQLLTFIQNEVIPDAGFKRREIEINWHGHQDRGLGVANNLAAVEAGADVLHGTALGVGERAGNAPLDQTLVNLSLMGVIDNDLTLLNEYMNKAHEYVEVALPRNYPVFGEDAFETGTGVHLSLIHI